MHANNTVYGRYSLLKEWVALKRACTRGGKNVHWALLIQVLDLFTIAREFGVMRNLSFKCVYLNFCLHLVPIRVGTIIGIGIGIGGAGGKFSF